MIFDILFIFVLIPAVGMSIAIANDRLETQGMQSNSSVSPLKLVISNPPNALSKIKE